MTELGAPERRLSRRPWWIAALIGFPLAGLTGMFDAGYFLPRHLAGTFAAGVLTALLIVCTVTDLAGKKIFNWRLTVPGFGQLWSTRALRSRRWRPINRWNSRWMNPSLRRFCNVLVRSGSRVA